MFATSAWSGDLFLWLLCGHLPNWRLTGRNQQKRQVKLLRFRFVILSYFPSYFCFVSFFFFLTGFGAGSFVAEGTWGSSFSKTFLGHRDLCRSSVACNVLELPAAALSLFCCACGQSLEPPLQCPSPSLLLISSVFAQTGFGFDFALPHTIVFNYFQWCPVQSKGVWGGLTYMKINQINSYS